jgi:tRNA dimethylallyltransferase
LTNPALVLLVGPTAVGKTEFAIQLAERLAGEIVSADSRLFYRGMDIGTAKPTLEERERVPHHLIDVAQPDQSWSLTVFQQQARAAIAEIYARGRLPLLVGGSGQYLRAVTQGWSPPAVAPNTHLRQVLESMASTRGNNWLHAGLRRLDPPAAAAIDPRNLRRTIRALEVILTSGMPFSAQRQQHPSPYQLLTIGLMRPRTELYQRVDQRIDAMFADGLLEEVQSLLDNGYHSDLPTLSAIGYREAAAVLRGELTILDAKTRMRRLTRAFVRRQANWFKANDQSINWFQAGQAGVIDEIESRIHAWLAMLDLGRKTRAGNLE